MTGGDDPDNLKFLNLYPWFSLVPYFKVKETKDYVTSPRSWTCDFLLLFYVISHRFHITSILQRLMLDNSSRIPYHTCGCVVNSPHNLTYGPRVVPGGILGLQGCTPHVWLCGKFTSQPHVWSPCGPVWYPCNSCGSVCSLQ